MLLRRGVGVGFYSVRPKIRTFDAESVVLLIMMGTYSGNVPLVQVRDRPKFASLMCRDRSNWPWCFLWHGWLRGLSSRTVGSPRAVAASDVARQNLENAPGVH